MCLIRRINELSNTSNTWSAIRSVCTARKVNWKASRRRENLVENAGGPKARGVDHHSRQRGIGSGITPFGDRCGLYDPAWLTIRGCVYTHRTRRIRHRASRVFDILLEAT